MNQSSDDAHTLDWQFESPDDELGAPVFARGRQIGRYRVMQSLGRGGFGTVYLAHDEQLHRNVAVKVAHRRQASSSEEVHGYLAEARVVASLDHPHIVPVYDAGQTTDGYCYIAAKYIKGTTLQARLREGRLGWAQTAHLICCLAEALDHAHRNGVTHRDVKPGNVLLDEAQGVYLADFGLAMKDGDLALRTRRGGTPSYMSPEQVRGEGHLLDGRSDIFSLGVVLYEMLTGARPFSGQTARELAEQIIDHEPPAPRQLERNVPSELERVCLRAISKRASDRYATAARMAEDLKRFLAIAFPPGSASPDSTTAPELVAPRDAAGPPMLSAAPSFRSADSSRGVRVIPKGLRAFDRQDADFFLSLLPGPRDHEGLPETIRDWKQRIETRDSEESIRLGVIYGPSGCGKSSWVKAGLLPRLDESIVSSAYVECTAGTTEVRLHRRLHYDIPQLPPQLSLRETMAALRRMPTLNNGRKLLIVLDQFEQWLHGRTIGDRSELIAALRQCDGRHVMCLVTVRDDFWLGLSRFLTELEVEMVAGHNMAMLDLFDRRHARRVLAAFGRAYECLPAERADMTADQERFLDQAVASLAENDKVVCVRLTLLAEMLKGKPWKSSVLQEMGGAEGVGAAFLEETFASSTADARYRMHAPAARSVLRALLPVPGSDIKGHMLSRDELLSASGYSRHSPRFDALLRILDGELRLVTPTEPAGLDDCDQTAADSEQVPGYYQLTHDYLVPSLREWLARKQRETARGRAELRLADRAQFWCLRPEHKQLPSWWEWLSACLLTDRKNWTDPQRRMMRAARRFHLARALLIVTGLLLILLVGIQFYRYQHAGTLVQRLLAAETAEAPKIAASLAPYRRWAVPMLREAARSDDPRRRLHTALALLPTDPTMVEQLQTLLLAARPVEMQVICQALQPYAAQLIPDLWRVEQDRHAPASRRFRAACALAAFDPDAPRWSACAPVTAAWLTAENPTLVPAWADRLAPIARWLTPTLQQLYCTTSNEQRFNAALVLARYLQPNTAELVALNRSSNDSQRLILLDALRSQQPATVALLTAELERAAADEAGAEERIRLAREKASAAAMLMLLAQTERVTTLLGQDQDPQLRTNLIHGLAPAGIDPGILVDLLESNQDALVRAALILSLGEYVHGPLLTTELQESLVPLVRQAFVGDPDSGVRSAAEWLLRQLGQAEEIAAGDAVLKTQGVTPDRNWYVNGQGQTFIIIRGPVEFMMGSPRGEPGRNGSEKLRRERIPRSFAISSKEITFQQFRGFWPGFKESIVGPGNDERPVDQVDFYAAMAYCNWLSGAEKLSPDDLCYRHDQDGRLQPFEGNDRRTGYRLPSEAEWEYACRHRTTTPYHFGWDIAYLDKYAWYAAPSGATQVVGALRPNTLGIFDMHGNVEELCEDVSSPENSRDEASFRVKRGGTVSSPPSELRSAARHSVLPNAPLIGLGFRVVCTLENQEETTGQN